MNPANMQFQDLLFKEKSNPETPSPYSKNWL